MSVETPAPAYDRARRWRTIALWVAISAVLGALAWQARTPGRISSDLRVLLPRNDASFTREMDFFARQGAARLMAVEATVADPQDLEAAETALRALAADLAPLEVKPLATDDPDAIPRAANVVESHLPLLVTSDELQALVPQLGADALTERLDALRERASQPEDTFVSTLARADILGLAAGAGRVLQAGLGGSRIDGKLMIKDEKYVLLVVEVPFDPSDSKKTAALMDVINGAAAKAPAGVHLEGIGAYRHFYENMQAVQSDLSSSLGISVVLIAALLYSLVPNLRALLVMQIPAVLGLVGSIAALIATGQPLPAPVLAFSAAILGVAVDAGQHVVVGIRSGHGADLRKPLLITFATTATAFAVLFTSSVPALRCIATMVIGGLATSLACALFLLPAITPRLKPHDPWLMVSRPMLALAQRRPALNWTIVVVLTAVLGWHLQDIRFVQDLKKYDGSRPETWKVLEDFEHRWSGEYRSADFLVVDDADLDRALDRASTARIALGAPMEPVEHLLPSLAEQRRRQQTWNDFWTTHGPEFATNLEQACTRSHLRFAAFAPSLERYRPVPEVDTLTLEDWAGTPLDKLIRGYVTQVDGQWQVALPLGKLAKDRVEAARASLAESGAWLAIREHIGAHLVDVVQADITTRGCAILIIILLLMWALQRDWRVVTAQLLPSLLALAWTFGLLAWLGVQLTPFAVLAAAFIAGIGIDSAVFLSEHPQAETLSPVLVASITTIAGVLSLVNATHPMISGMGRVLAVGMTFCLLSCLLVTPSLAASFRRPPGHPSEP